MTYLALLATTIALQVGGRAPVKSAAPPKVRSDSAVLVDTVVAAERTFFRLWRAAWIASDAPRRRYPGIPWLDPSKADLACNPDPAIYVPDNAWGLNFHLRMISDAHSAVAVCPNWFPPAGFYIPPAKVKDERLSIDGGLSQRVLPAVVSQRQRVITLFDSAVRRMPAHTLLTGQLVRLLVDQDSLDRALAVVRDCHTLDWWCNALSGYVHARKGNQLDAEVFFTAAAQGLVDADRCTWTDVGVLLDSAGRAAYTKMSCAERQTFNERFWWLADPLWSEPGNDRLVEQFARQVMVTLHAAVGTDERYSWAALRGGEALNQTISRYGWPTYAYWGQVLPPGVPPPSAPMKHINGADTTHIAGMRPIATSTQSGVGGTGAWYDNTPIKTAIDRMLDDMSQSCLPGYPGEPPVCTQSIMREAMSKVDPVDSALPALGSTIEYSVGRVHLVPHWKTFENPFGARNTDWELNAPRTEAFDVLKWWPWEHYASPHPLMQIEDQQTALLRRQTGALIAYATALGGTDLHRNPNDTVHARLVASTGPDAIATLGEKRVAIASTLTFLEGIASRPTMIGVEIPAGVDSQAAARARFGVTPKPALASMRRDSIDISDPVLLAAPAMIDALPNDIDGVLPLMLGSTRLAQGVSRVGVYWETYGIAATDTVSIAIRVQRTTPLTVLDRVGAVTGLGGNSNAPVSFEWKEPDPRHQVRTLGGTVPIQMRSVVIDISTLTTGDYSLEIAVTKAGRAPVRSSREFTVR
jgi:hypothetical protein